MSSFLMLSTAIVALLSIATVISRGLVWQKGATPTLANLNERIDAWWIMVLVALPVIAAGPLAATILFALLSFLTLREFLSLTPTHKTDRLSLFASFFLAIPVQYVLVAIDWYALFSILIPVYGFFFVSALTTLRQTTDNFLERKARLQWAIMVCVYGLSHAPALLYLDIPGYDASNGLLLLFFLVVVQLSDVFQYVCGKLFGKHKLAPLLSPNKTVEGLVGGGLLASLVGASLHGFTPFGFVAAWLLSLAVVISGALGGLILSAVKRSLGVKDWGQSIPGHGGTLDRLDSVAFSAPIFFHLTRYFYA